MTILPRCWALRVAGVALLVGCGRDADRPPMASPPTPVPASAPAEPSPPASGPLEVVDGFGRKVVVKRPAARIVSLAPSNTEILYAVGAGDRLVGRTTVCTYPREAADVPTVGGMTPKTVNLEALVASRPDLVLATCGVQEPLMEPLERLGLAVVALDADDFAAVARNIRLVGAMADRVAEGDRLASRFLDRIEAVRGRVAARPGPRPRVLYLVGEDPLMTVGPQTFIGRMIEAAGGTNIFGDVAARYPRPSEEEILARAPEVILVAVGAMNAGGGDDRAGRARIAARPGWGRIPAVRAGRVRFLAEDPMSRPGPRLADGLEAVAAALETAGPAPSH